MSGHIEINRRMIGPGHRTFIIAEVAQAHDGSLGMAHAFVEAAADAGADSVKFQTHIAAAESTLDEPFRVNFSQQDASRYDYWRRMEFTHEQWASLAAHSRDRGLAFLSTPFSLAAIALLAGLGMPAWKVGSGEHHSRELMTIMAQTGAPILYSTGMATRSEIADAVSWFRAAHVPHALLQCTSLYPTPLDKVGLNVIEELRVEHCCPVGLSDHSGSPYPGLAAVARGADILEVHVTFHRGMFGPDVPASVTIDELRMLCTLRDAVATMDANPVDKNDLAGNMGELRRMFGRSLAPARHLPAGTALEPGMLTTKKPAGGIAPESAAQLIGKRLTRDVAPERILCPDDIEGGWA